MISVATVFSLTIATTLPASAPPAPLSLLGDDALCDEESPADAAPASDEAISLAVNCSEMPPAPIVDCNDARSSLWVQEMIGSCDMPRSAAGALRPRGSNERPGQCTGLACTHDASPIDAAPPDAPETPSALPNPIRLTAFLDGEPLVAQHELLLHSVHARRLERPPRTI